MADANMVACNEFKNIFEDSLKLKAGHPYRPKTMLFWKCSSHLDIMGAQLIHSELHPYSGANLGIHRGIRGSFPVKKSLMEQSGVLKVSIANLSAARGL